MRSNFSPLVLLLTLAAPFALAACHTAPAGPAPAPVSTTAGEPISFWENLPAARSVRTDDALRALAEFGKLENADSLSHADRVAAMRKQGWLASGAPDAPEAAVTRGQVAAILCPMLGIKGGLSMRIDSPWGVSERYATRELVSLGILPPASSPDQSFSGLEFLRTLSFAERHQEAK